MGCNSSKSAKEAHKAAEGRIGARTFISFESKLKAEWKAGDTNGDGEMSFKEVKRLLHKLNLSIPERQLRKEFERFDTDGDKSLNFNEFTNLFRKVRSVPDMNSVFILATGGKSDMIADELRRFLVSSSAGKMSVGIRECVHLILIHEGASKSDITATLGSGPQLEDQDDDVDTFAEFPRLSYDGFMRIMTDPNVNNIMESRKYKEVYQDMSLPLSNYFISSSHNTYLKGNQINGESSPVAIERAIKQGVRVIELDCWDGSRLEDGPIVNHGHTMCKPTSFKGCIQAMADLAFKVSEYPLIITIENHCSLPFQTVQIDMLEKAFGERLYMWAGRLDADGKKDWTSGPLEWESPESLKGKVVIRDKPIKKKGASLKEPSAADGKDLDMMNISMRDVKVNDEVVTTNDTSSLQDESDEDEEVDTQMAYSLGVDQRLLRTMYIKNVKIKAIVDKESALVVYKEPSFRSSSSLGESKMLKLTKPGYHARDLAIYARYHLVRVYPAGKRIDSSNYDPCGAWNAGCQVVALNYQTNTLPVWLASGKFSDNGGSGFILKPDFLRYDSGGQKWDAKPSKKLATLKITVLSGHYLPKPLTKGSKSEVIDPYVVVSMHGVEVDNKKFTTKHIDNNGFNPKWNESFTFEISAPELALLSFVVHDKDLVSKDDFIGQAVIPVTAMVPGFKTVPLRYANGAIQDSFLFVRIEFSPSPPTSSVDN